MTSSARASSDGGTLRPSDRAALRFNDSSNFVWPQRAACLDAPSLSGDFTVAILAAPTALYFAAPGF
jgi:hypothetical protein